MEGDEGYLLDNQRAEAGQRFAALAALFDPSTFRHLTKLGLRAGWRVWEVGAGGPSVPDWLAHQTPPRRGGPARDPGNPRVPGGTPRANPRGLRHHGGP